MADTKISDMTAATDLDSATIPIVQAGVNKKAAISIFDTRLGSLDVLSDVDIYEPDNNQILVYNESTGKWENENQVRIQSVTSSATVTPNADTNDMVIITAQAVALALANPSGNPRDGQLIVIRIKDNATARAITFGSSYRAMGITLPTTTVLSKLMYLPMVYNLADGKWDVFNVINEA